ncbi:MAG: chemotaxis protein CheW [Magnetococcales bacterium]|nr:chemotaxis protein CheW [Magnetococcales bacterium]
MRNTPGRRPQVKSVARTVQSVVTLGIADDLFAVDVIHVREILDFQPVARLPHAPGALLGMIDVRGQTVPVIDLRRKLGYPDAVITERSRILVLEVTVGARPLVLGLLCDVVFEVAEFDLSTLEKPPETGFSWNAAYLRGVGRRHGRFVLLFDLERLFAGDEALPMTGAET